MEAERAVFKKDTQGNELFTKGNFIWLGQKGKPDERIGQFDLPKKQLVIHKEYLDYNERFKSYGFNEAVLRAAKKCDTVHLICQEGKFDIPIEVILTYGTVLIYEKFDLTRELFIELSLIKKYPAPAEKE